jgi:hypothetical protein
LLFNGTGGHELPVLYTHRGEKGRGAIGGVYLALSAGVYTTTLLVMVDRVKRGGRAPLPKTGLA